MSDSHVLHKNADDPAQRQWINRNRRNLTPPFKKRVLVYNDEKGDLEVRMKKEVEQDLKYERLEINALADGVPLFVDQDKSKPTTKAANSDGRSNVLVAFLYPKRLGIVDKLWHRLSGQLSFSYLYVTNTGAKSGEMVS
ncbi:MAG: hypothetical protein Q9165_004957 [Trypethelium subeluteriae]